MRLEWIALGILLTACPVPPDCPVVGDAAAPLEDADAAKSPCGMACANLQKLACPEGLSPNCYRGCVRQSALERTPLSCWAAAATTADVRACGPQLRCSK